LKASGRGVGVGAKSIFFSSSYGESILMIESEVTSLTIADEMAGADVCFPG